MIQKILITIFATLLTLSALHAQTPKHCKGTTTHHQPCKQTFIDSTGYCRYHSPTRILCAHAPCHMVVKVKGEFCRFHAKTAQ